MKKHHILISALSSCLAFLALHCQAVEPDALTRAEAVEKATSQDKMILLIVSDTNNCTGCLTLEFQTLPSTNNPPMRQFLGESFIYWACGPEQNCTEYRTYTGPGTRPLPMFYIIDPQNPQNYYPGFGDADPLIFYNWLRTGLLRTTKPLVSTPQQNESFPDKNIVVQGRSISTNVTIMGVYYRLNSGTWTFSKVSDGLNWQVPLDPAQVTDSNVFRVYAIDGSLNKSQTNKVTFFSSPGEPTPVPAAPKMALGRTNNIVTIIWPTNAIGLKLQSTPVLPATNWQDVAASEMTNLVIVSIGSSNRFFRLKN